MHGFSQLLVLPPLSHRTLHLGELCLELHHTSALLTDPILKLIAQITLDHAPVRDFLGDRDRVFDKSLRRIPEGPDERSLAALFFCHKPPNGFEPSTC